jgi:hypothetical protein
MQAGQLPRLRHFAMHFAKQSCAVARQAAAYAETRVRKRRRHSSNSRRDLSAALFSTARKTRHPANHQAGSSSKMFSAERREATRRGDFVPMSAPAMLPNSEIAMDAQSTRAA